MILKLENVTKKYSKVTALDSINTSFETGHIYGLLGRNGAGKSTMIKIITGKIYPGEGRILLDNLDPTMNESAKRNIYSIGEDNPFVSDEKVKKIFKEFAYYTNRNFDDMCALAESFELNINKSWEKQSTGYRTIFKDILALTSPSNFIFFDEPILGLDATHRDNFYQLMLEKYSPDKCFIISTHLIDEVSKLIDSVKLIHKGKLICDDDKDLLLQDVHSINLRNDEKLDLSNVTILSDKVASLSRTIIYKGELNVSPERINNVDLQEYFIAVCK